MAPVIKKVLVLTTTYLVDNVTDDRLTDALSEAGIINPEEDARIRSKTHETKQDSVRTLLEILGKKDDHVINFLLEYFGRANGEAHIKDKIWVSVQKANIANNYPATYNWKPVNGWQLGIGQQIANSTNAHTQNNQFPTSQSYLAEEPSPRISRGRELHIKSDTLPFPTPLSFQKSLVYNNGDNDDTFSQCYKMNSNPRGHSLIINNMSFVKNGRRPNPKLPRRDGSEIDFENMKHFQREFGFAIFNDGNVDVIRDCDTDGSKHLYTILGDFKAECVRNSADSCLITIMTHGAGEKGHLMMSDSKKVDLDRIIDKFSNDNFPRFKGKPKVFFIQACREEPVGDLVIDNYIPKTTSCNMSDVYILHSTLPLAVAYRNTSVGSPFINCLINIYRENAHNQHVLELQTKVHRKMLEHFGNRNIQQMTNADDRGLLKKLYFNPGLGY